VRSLVNVFEVPADMLIKELAEHLKKHYGDIIRPPYWAYFVKTGPHKERPPTDPDWWYYRCASIMRKLYVRGRPVGVERLRRAYGGRKNYGVAPEHFVKASGSIIRVALQQLEKAGLVTKVERKGRALSPLGRSLLDRLSGKIMRELARHRPELRKYLGGAR